MAIVESKLKYADFREKRELTPNVYISHEDAKLMYQTAFKQGQQTWAAVETNGVPLFVPDHYQRGRSSRSRIAQVGMEVLNDRAIVAKDGTMYVPVVNHSQRDIIVPEGMGLYRDYAYGKTLQGQALTDMIGDDKFIRIDGKKGTDWQFHMQNGVTTGIDFALDPTYRVHLPPDEEALEFPYNPKNSGGRVDTDTLLKPITPNEQNMHWVGRTTAIISLDRSVHGILRQEMTSRNHLYISPQINSLLAEGQFTKWHVRTECIGPTTEDLIAGIVTIEFVAD